MLTQPANVILFMVAFLFSTTALPGRSYKPSRFRPYNEPFVVHSVSKFQDEYADRLILVLQAYFHQQYAKIKLLDRDPISLQDLKQDLRGDRNPKRFIHLGQVVPHRANMVVATYLNRPPNSDGSRKFVLLSILRPQSSDAPHVFIHGYADVAGLEDIEDQLRNTVNSASDDPQFGHVLSIEGVFETLSRM
ncbi:hypothetical protein NDA11_004521 [Ustilago hordei]|uniref:UHOR_10021-like protein n=1 Tax=Ustilago hordei TaxID=120017 RepID=W0IWP3_USTHO|nr:UHOR_10021-like protein [Ustilago hordei]KAJ1041977.1 hypothetical protein NDA10_002112 [Ustilago hordei]KAJ1573398.1 hypothetical protein NDA15_007414 [Ustilago hordei]KAJ1574854.1 hypothetical protein NDA12_007094 [Ustilago hordei]KAJ1576693.1 hypothetical protein NDA11_004521 [Ustilago hordei]